MKPGVSTYSLLQAIKAGEMTVLDVIDWIAEQGGEHMEIVPYGFTLEDQPELADAVRERAAAKGIALSNYSMPANFVQETQEAFEAEMERVKRHVDTVHRLGMKHMRHDVTAFTLPPEKWGIDYLEDNLAQIVEGCRRIADYAAQYGITTTIENHGVSVQASDRVQRVLRAVDRPNFKTTLDIGNFLCVDEQPLVGVKRNLPFASLIHVKDFYIRPADQNPGGRSLVPDVPWKLPAGIDLRARRRRRAAGAADDQGVRLRRIRHAGIRRHGGVPRRHEAGP